MDLRRIKPLYFSAKEPKAVMMWIYGGSLTAGSNQYQEYGAMRWVDDGIFNENLHNISKFCPSSSSIYENVVLSEDSQAMLKNFQLQNFAKLCPEKRKYI